MKSFFLTGLLLSGFAMATEPACKPSECFSVAMKAFEAGKHSEAMPILEPMCNKDNNGSACHLVGIMWSVNKTDKDAKAKATAAFKKACDQLHNKQACEDMKKFK